MSEPSVTRIIAAYLLDRADQYETESPCWIALADAAHNIMLGEHRKSYKEGEFDRELFARVDGMKGKPRKIKPRAGIDEMPLPRERVGKCAGCGCPIAPSETICGECACEDDCAP